MTNNSKQEKLSLFILLTLSITSLSSYANVKNFSTQKINNKETPTKFNPQYKLSRINPQEKTTIKFSQLNELLKQNPKNLILNTTKVEILRESKKYEEALILVNNQYNNNLVNGK